MTRDMAAFEAAIKRFMERLNEDEEASLEADDIEAVNPYLEGFENVNFVMCATAWPIPSPTTPSSNHADAPGNAWRRSIRAQGGRGEGRTRLQRGGREAGRGRAGGHAG